MVNHAAMKLGKKAPRHDNRTLLLANYLKHDVLPPPPPSLDYAAKSGIKSWGMMANDSIGDCTCAAAGHEIMLWTALAGRPVVPADADIVAAYSAITGYDPNDPNTDQGANEIDVLNYFRNTGIAGHKIGAYFACEPANIDHVKIGCDLGVGVYIGLALPLSAQTQAVWSVPIGGARGRGAPGSWGGHAVPVVAYDAHGLTVVTWGQLKRMSWRFWQDYCEEAYVIASTDYLDGSGKAPAGIDWAALQADLAAL